MLRDPRREMLDPPGGEFGELRVAWQHLLDIAQDHGNVRQVAAFAVTQPLSDEVRPIIEPAAEYLSWMQAQVARARSEDPNFKGEWVYFFITTAPATE